MTATLKPKARAAVQHPAFGRFLPTTNQTEQVTDYRITVAEVGVAEHVRLDFGRIDGVHARQHKNVGAGLTAEQFQRQVDDGRVRHVGLTESIAMIADALGWTLDRITDDVQPKLAAEAMAKSPDRQLVAVMALEGTPFFNKVRGTCVGALYDNPLAYAHFGYEGSSWEKGGYLHRGFNDLTWLHEPPPNALSPACAKSQTYSASRGIRSGRHWYFPEDSGLSVGIFVSIASRAARYTS